MALYITQNGTGKGFYIYWITCLDCGWQSMVLHMKSDEDTCYLCESKNIKYKDEDEDYFKEAQDKLLKNREKYRDRILEKEA